MPARFSGAEDLRNHIRFGEPIPARSFADSEAAKAYVLSGLDRARELLLGVGYGHELARRVADGVHDVRRLVAADQSAAAVASSANLRARLGPEAERAHGEARRLLRRVQFKKAFAFCAYWLVEYCTISDRLDFGPVPEAAATFLLGLSWLLLYGRLVEEAWMLEEEERVALEIQREMAAVSDILRRLIN